MQDYPLGYSYLVGSVLSIGSIGFVFDYGSLSHLLSLLFCPGVTFPLIALDKISLHFLSNAPTNYSQIRPALQQVPTHSTLELCL